MDTIFFRDRLPGTREWRMMKKRITFFPNDPFPCDAPKIKKLLIGEYDRIVSINDENRIGDVIEE